MKQTQIDNFLDEEDFNKLKDLIMEVTQPKFEQIKLPYPYKDYEPAFTQYLKDIGKSTRFKSYNLNDRMQFSNLVSRAVRGEVIDIPAVTQGAEATKRLIKDYGGIVM